MKEREWEQENKDEDEGEDNDKGQIIKTNVDIESKKPKSNATN